MKKRGKHKKRTRKIEERNVRINNAFWDFIEGHGKKVIIGVILIIIFAFLIYCLIWLNTFNNYKNHGEHDWISFIGSYWGGILGGFISGILSVIGTWLIISYTLKTDYHRQRMEFMPLLSISSLRKFNNNIIVDYYCDIEYSEMTEENKFVFDLKNVGKGVAINIRFYNPEEWNEEVIRTVFDANTPLSICMTIDSDMFEPLNKSRSTLIDLRYSDIFDNKYKQTYTVFYCEDSKNQYSIKASVPELIQKTRRKQYTQ